MYVRNLYRVNAYLTIEAFATGPNIIVSREFMQLDSLSAFCGYCFNLRCIVQDSRECNKGSTSVHSLNKTPLHIMTKTTPITTPIRACCKAEAFV
jgi:hypothetical protein